MDRSKVRAAMPWLVALVAVAAAALWAGWIGYIGSDDALYYAGARHWLTDPPFAGSDHWSTRFPLTLAFAAVLAAIGPTLAAFAATAVLCYGLLVTVVGVSASRIGGARAGWTTAIIVASLPVIVGNASTVSVDLIEAAALVGGAMLVARATDDRAGWRRGVAGGACFGIAILCRETSVLPLAAFVPMFFLGKPVPRRVLIAAGAGMAIVLGGEALFQYAMTGDPLRRYAIAFHHDEHIDRAANMEGNFLLWPPIDPLLVLLVNDDFGLLFWLLPVALAAGAARGLGEVARRRLLVLAAMAGVSFVLVAVLTTKLVLNPRYFTLPALVAAIVVALWLERLEGRWRAIVLGGIVASNVALLSLGNAHPHREMEVLVTAARAHPRETVTGTPHEVRRAATSMALIGQRNLADTPARPGGLAIVPEDRAAGQTVIARYPSPPTRAGEILRALRMEPLVPAPIARRVFAPSPAYVLIRTRG